MKIKGIDEFVKETKKMYMNWRVLQPYNITRNKWLGQMMWSFKLPIFYYAFTFLFAKPTMPATGTQYNNKHQKPSFSTSSVHLMSLPQKSQCPQNTQQIFNICLWVSSAPCRIRWPGEVLLLWEYHPWITMTWWVQDSCQTAAWIPGCTPCTQSCLASFPRALHRPEIKKNIYIFKTRHEIL